MAQDMKIEKLTEVGTQDKSLSWRSTYALSTVSFFSYIAVRAR